MLLSLHLVGFAETRCIVVSWRGGHRWGPGSVTDPVGKSTGPLAAAQEASRGQRVSWLVSRWPQARGLKLQSAGRRGLLGTDTDVVPWHVAAHVRALTSLVGGIRSCCLPGICGCLSVSTSDLF